MIHQITNLEINKLQAILEESQLLGYGMIERLLHEWQSGINTFSKPNEAFWGYSTNQTLVAVGGINQDPYLENPLYGRIRHLYVLKDWRQKGIGTSLINTIIVFASQHYSSLTLRTPADGSADRFYETLGFRSQNQLKTVSHIYHL